MPPQQFLENYPYLNPEDIADGVVYVLGAPPHVQVRRSSVRHLRQGVMIFDIRFRPRPKLSNRGGAQITAFKILFSHEDGKNKHSSTILLYMYQITRPHNPEDGYRKM